MNMSTASIEGNSTPSPLKGQTTQATRVVKKYGSKLNDPSQTPTSNDKQALFNMENLRRAVHEENDDLVYFPVDIELNKMRDWGATSRVHNTEKSSKGTLVTVNSTDLAVFKYGESVIATSAKCPHAGGPLHLGDIEVLPDRSLCVKCPWHKWAFCVGRKQEDSGVVGEVRRNLFGERKGVGECVFPEGREGIQVFPTKLVARNKVKIGFQNFHNDSLVGEIF